MEKKIMMAGVVSKRNSTGEGKWDMRDGVTVPQSYCRGRI
jgi:hypothetical protein